MEYYCEFCKYKTTISKNWNIHLRSIKHITMSNNIEDGQNIKYCCESCNYKTNNAKNWYSHKKSIKHITLSNNDETNNNINNETNNNINDDKNNLLIEKLKSAETIVDMLKKQIEDKNMQIKKLETDNKKLKEQNNYFIKELQLEKRELKDKLLLEQDYSKQVINNAGTIVNKSISTLQYITQNYNTAPRLMALEDYSNISENDNKLIDNLIYYQNKGTLHEYIGNYIVENYKKNDPKTQAIWNTDTDRLNYVIRELLYKNIDKTDQIIIEEIHENNIKQHKLDKLDKLDKLEWIVDKKGNRVCKQIIEPILSYIKTKCIDFINKYNNDIRISTNSGKIYKKMETLADINTNILNNDLSKNINKYISSHLYFNKHI